MDAEKKYVEPSSTKQNCGKWEKKLAVFRYPKAVFFCLGNEFAERFSFLGMTAILTLYLVNVQHLPDYKAKLIFHAFQFVVFFTPILGSILADGFLGRFRIILYVSIFYCFGHLLLTLGSLEGVVDDVGRILDYIGLFVIAVSTGGIKPCVVAFAADQFQPTQFAERKQVFSFFYLIINIGSLLSTFITPIFRSKVSCYGREGCYPLAFGVPAIFMALALIIFICGKPFYNIVKCEENIIWIICKCITTGIVKTVKHRGPPIQGGHWLDHSIPIYGRRLVADIKTMFSIMLIFVPVIFFCALLSQQGSTWVLQANRMDGRLGQLTIIPEQMNILNPLLIIILIPIFERYVYPILKKRNFLVTPLRRMGWGGVLAAVSFFIAGFIQLKINENLIQKPPDGFLKYDMTNFADCHIKFLDANFTLMAHTSVDQNFQISQTGNSLPEFVYENCNQPFVNDSTIDVGKGQLVVFWDKKNISQSSYVLEKTVDSQSRIYPVFHPSYYDERFDEVSIVSTLEGKYSKSFTLLNSTIQYFNLEPPYFGSNVVNLRLKVCKTNLSCNYTDLQTLTIDAGQASALIIFRNGTSILRTLVAPNTVHILWQVPQYVIITVAEILFSISSLQFAYSQGAPSMKSVFQAICLMTAAFGNVFNMIISGNSMVTNPAAEFFIYAITMVGVIFVFAFLAYRYQYVNEDEVLGELRS